jgi:membrane fusion protein (multidrug efflux system)
LYFESGIEVGAGDLLVQQFIDDDLARLNALKAELRLAEITLQRATELVRDRLVPQLDLDTAESNLDRIQAELESVQVTIDKKSIRAPFAGQLGIRRVNIGQYIQPGDNIVKLESLNQILVVFPRSVHSAGRRYCQTGVAAEYSGGISVAAAALAAGARGPDCGSQR